MILISALLVACVALLLIISSIVVVPESKIFVIEQFGRFRRVLKPGLNFLIPLLEKVAHRVDILERQIPTKKLSVITQDNVEIELEVSVFYRIVSAEYSVYRIKDVEGAISVTTSSIIRAACGELQFDEIQSRREYLNHKIKEDVSEATQIWGIEITRTEMLEVRVDESTRQAMRRQITAAREKRAAILKAEGERKALELDAEAELFRAKKDAEAKQIAAEAEANATAMISEAIAKKGRYAADFEIMKRKVDAIRELATSKNTKILILPTDVTGILGSLETLSETIFAKEKEMNIERYQDNLEAQEETITEKKTEPDA
ncbi:MAG: SPFH domain-containing protein [Pseudomonadota bacterium]